ncbi:quinoprotein dehydrogenase-associated putative ABC transporter substrate-binding protein [Halomonas sp. MCCC 1A17488]|uniref:Quinoprotein dehydrogenase-associated putative ABC transporter substrate-binding protein n=1 Tax=Billgrantia sulfidoxydans TaxID=2733484 RepID=A0ABX7W9W6_9GAMM|nr:MULTISPECIES: substrate-binding domain-containing protein [Halomonas]MCE8018488.1 quinoprotein dehydrogenase-associated putative ABC transporter substrate-binding protein [Halomonas sp. MCCC 1A17488]MCG3241821.1 quinoprotein dehydrogenase-associated putative ABC transporter substrate-binding protein [Halomonas sp. MCCC 1A17488]QPP49186.1 substrate-binding domain-containing protein [Halomonas sp. SS10-MC5]QTP56522.1 quinoprotein dehydrogenase-associated putative ABC transporter substrate-bind
MRAACRQSVRTAMLILGLVAASTAVAEPPERQEREALRVCADGNNLPFSNQAGEGFENRIAEMMAEDLGVPLTYVWAPQVMGFVRNTLELRVCDLIMGTPAGYEFVQNTNPYYRSVYSLVVPEDSELDVTRLSDPAFEGRRIGVVAETPPAVPLRRSGARIQGYPLMVDTRVRAPVRDAIEDVVSGHTDGAVLWGPLAGYYAARQDPPLEVIPLVDDDTGAQLDYRITMGVRHGEPHWKDWINDFIDRHQAEIDAILADYGVPLLDRRGRLIEAGQGEGS